MRNGWTGGQYSLYRFLLGASLSLYYLHLLPWGAELFSGQGALRESAWRHQTSWFPNLLALWNAPEVTVFLFLFAGALLGLLLAAGLKDRWAALGLWYIGACLLDRNPLILNPHLPFVGWILLLHAFLPEAPYGSFEARGRRDFGASWEFPPALYGAAWLVVSWSYTYSGYLKLFTPAWRNGTALAWVLRDPLARDTFLTHLLASLPAWLLAAPAFFVVWLEFLNGPLALVRRLRPFLWVSILLMHLGIFLLLDFGELTWGMLLVQFLLFDPAWVAPKTVSGTPVLFYDGRCGLCHRTVKFILAEDRRQPVFHFSPLQGEQIRRSLPPQALGGLPDSLVVLTPEGGVLTRSEAVLFILSTLGGLWRLLAAVGKRAPGNFRDALYDAVARVRHRLFREPENLCPLVPSGLKSRFRD